MKFDFALAFSFFNAVYFSEHPMIVPVSSKYSPRSSEFVLSSDQAVFTDPIKAFSQLYSNNPALLPDFGVQIFPIME